MSIYGKLNLAGMLLLPVVATLAAAIVFAEQATMKTFVAVFGLNLIPMILSGIVAGVLIRSANRKGGGRGAAIAVSPTLVPAVVGALAYLWYAINPPAVAAGGEYLGFPQYLLMGVVLLSVVAVSLKNLARRTG